MINKHEAKKSAQVHRIQLAEHHMMDALVQLVDYITPPADEHHISTVLQHELRITEAIISTENRVFFAQQAYNDTILAYNQYLNSIPSRLLGTKRQHPMLQSIESYDIKSYEKLKSHQSLWKNLNQKTT
ncbi:MAG: LemA family protein [Mariprofundaceae bacterium]|nr:LemA family protein [Mariprofundaceae bacterium]